MPPGIHNESGITIVIQYECTKNAIVSTRKEVSANIIILGYTRAAGFSDILFSYLSGFPNFATNWS